MGNSYCKKDLSKGKVNVVETTQIRLQKIKKSVEELFIVLLVKFGKKTEKKNGKKCLVCVISLCCFLHFYAGL